MRRFGLWLGILLLIVVDLVLVVGLATPALAEHGPYPLAAPDSHGNYAYCKVRTLRETGYANSYALVTCNFGGANPTDLLIDIDINGDGTRDFSHSGWSSSWLSFPSTGRLQARWGAKVYNPSIDSERTGTSITQCKMTQGGVQRAIGCTVQSGAGDLPPYPPQWFVGGTEILAPLSTPAPTCSRTLSSKEETFAWFKAGVSNVPEANATDAFSWQWGDGTAPWGQAESGHDYPVLSSQPANGWTATVTVTRTRGTETTTATCGLRVDFHNPDKSAPGSTDGGEGGHECPTGFGWINPLAIVKIAKCLFIPTQTTTNGLRSVWGDLSTKVPFSYGVDVVTYLPDRLGEVKQGINGVSGQDAAGGDRTGCTNLFAGNDPVPYSGAGDVFSGTSLEGRYTGEGSWCRSTMADGEINPNHTLRNILLVIIGIALALGTYHIFSKALGGSS